MSRNYFNLSIFFLHLTKAKATDISSAPTNTDKWNRETYMSALSVLLWTWRTYRWRLFSLVRGPTQSPFPFFA